MLPIFAMTNCIPKMFWIWSLILPWTSSTTLCHHFFMFMPIAPIHLGGATRILNVFYYQLHIWVILKTQTYSWGIKGFNKPLCMEHNSRWLVLKSMKCKKDDTKTVLLLWNSKGIQMRNTLRLKIRIFDLDGLRCFESKNF